MFKCFYRPPSFPSSIFDTLCDTLLSIDHAYFSNFVILSVNFELSHHLHSHLSDFMTSFSLTQVVDSPTHFSPSGQPSHSRDDHLMFKKFRDKVVAHLRHAKCEFLGNLHPHNQKEFWKVVKSLNSKQSVIPTLRNGDIIAASNLEKANLLSASLVKNFNHSLPGLKLSDLPRISPDSCPTDFLCTEEEVYSLMSTLDNTKASGHDDISARMLKKI